MRCITLFSLALLSLCSALFVHGIPSASSAYDEGEWVQYDKRAQLKPRVGDRSYKTVRGVNLGGWLVLEAWMTPDLFTPDLVAKGAIDQWTFMTAVNDSARALQLLKQHWGTWITETDFRAIKAAGLNTVRLPVGHWTFNASKAEPYAAYAEVPYVSQALLWANKYGLDVMLDLVSGVRKRCATRPLDADCAHSRQHTAPNSQNGFDNSGKQGPISFGKVNAAQNAARVYSALQSMVRMYVNNARYKGVVKSIEILNEPACWVLGQAYMTTIHKAAYKAIKSTVSSSALTFPTIIIHDCFVQPLGNWYSTYADTKTWTTGSYAIDTHRYTAFQPIAGQLNGNYTKHINFVCGLQSELSAAYAKFPLVVGEWSLGVACSNCTYKTMAESVASQNNQTQNLFYRQFYEAQVMSYEKAGGWIFWSWKTQSMAAWSYQAGLAQGWIPSSPTKRVFKQANGCPTALLSSQVTFATTSNSTTTTTSTSVKRSDIWSLIDSLAHNLPLVKYDGNATLDGILQQLVPKITAIAQTLINSNAFPFIRATTFGQGIWH